MTILGRRPLRLTELVASLQWSKPQTLRDHALLQAQLYLLNLKESHRPIFVIKRHLLNKQSGRFNQMIKLACLICYDTGSGLTNRSVVVLLG